jgi:hypothetical protein
MTNTFYTSAFRHGKVIKYMGYEDGKKVSFTVPYHPTLFVTSKQNNAHDWHALDGTPVEPIQFGSMGEATLSSRTVMYLTLKCLAIPIMLCNI